MADSIAKEFQENGVWAVSSIIRNFYILGGMITKDDLANYKVRVYDTPLINDHFR